MKYLRTVLLTLSFIQSGFAADAVKVSAKSKAAIEKTGETLDVEGKKSDSDLDLMTQEHDMKVDVTCKLKDGKEIKEGETGYEDCLKKAKPKKNSKKAPAADVKVDVKK